MAALINNNFGRIIFLWLVERVVDVYAKVGSVGKVLCSEASLKLTSGFAGGEGKSNAVDGKCRVLSIREGKRLGKVACVITNGMCKPFLVYTDGIATAHEWAMEVACAGGIDSDLGTCFELTTACAECQLLGDDAVIFGTATGVPFAHGSWGRSVG